MFMIQNGPLKTEYFQWKLYNLFKSINNLLHFNSWFFSIIPSPTVCQNVTIIYNKKNTIDDQYYLTT